jgi:hypothetical protein
LEQLLAFGSHRDMESMAGMTGGKMDPQRLAEAWRITH